MDVKEERKFLHDISTPMSTAFFLLDMTIERFAGDQEKYTEELKMLHGSVRSLKTIKELIQKRREHLIALDEQVNE